MREMLQKAATVGVESYKIWGVVILFAEKGLTFGGLLAVSLVGEEESAAIERGRPCA